MFIICVCHNSPVELPFGLFFTELWNVCTRQDKNKTNFKFRLRGHRSEREKKITNHLELNTFRKYTEITKSI